MESMELLCGNKYLFLMRLTELQINKFFCNNQMIFRIF